MRLFDDPIDDVDATRQSVPAQLDRVCLELRIGDRIPMRNCTSPRADGPLLIGGAALFEDGSGPTIMMATVLVDNTVTSVEFATSQGTESSEPSRLPSNRGSVAVLRVRCDRADECNPTLRVVATDVTMDYVIRVGDARYPLGEFVPST